MLGIGRGSMELIVEQNKSRLAQVRLLALDVDGVLTDGGVYYDSAGTEAKRFHIQDGLGLVLARLSGLLIIWITGRTSPIVERRAQELQVAQLVQGVRNKAETLAQIAADFNIPSEHIAYMGDDLNDLPALRWAGIPLAPANARPEVRAVAYYTTTVAGGSGAVREVIDLILQARGNYDTTLQAYDRFLTEPPAPTPEAVQ